jgi:hypothetical protein
MTPEGKVKAEIKKVLAEYGCWYFMPAMNGYGRTGIPDFVGCYNGVFFAIEAKSANGKLTPNQEREVAAIRQAHGAVTVAYNGNDVRGMLDAISVQCKA